MSTGYPTVLVGFGKMAQGYAADTAMAQHFPYASHAQVLRDHPRFDWLAVIDPAPDARALARDEWGVRHIAAQAGELDRAHDNIEVAILATGPDARRGLIDRFPNLKAVIVEKPLGRTADDAEAFLDECRTRNIIVQVNLWRRADERFRALADGDLDRLIGEIQVGTCYYGNGLVNNGTHMVDFARMLLGEVTGWQLSGASPGFIEGPIPGDSNPHFQLRFGDDVEVAFQPLRFRHYRECGLSLLGTHGKLDIMAEGLDIALSAKTAHRAATGENELAVDRPTRIAPTCGRALYRMYDNLADCLDSGQSADLWSDGVSAMKSTAVIDQIRLADQARQTPPQAT
ncbi:Gfo/Idh/MocA family protein [Sphingopyxis sp. C-1]|uniref:Gfo/Idh/MocA family protein n=1 Tax=Sphingopyxis sp. C-1 TaxID=262667 RepID=UPI00078551E6|nr:Gfo/Idh/MocA family oxidoreductase [Sphingopyxis sp. C-1]